MNLATRCASCGTVFRVARDQLRVSEGWVRCGRCDAVFDAAEVLFDVDNGMPVHLDLDPALEPAPDPADGGRAEPDQSFGPTGSEHSGTEPNTSDWAASPAASPSPASTARVSGPATESPSVLHWTGPPLGRPEDGGRLSGRQEPHFQADPAPTPAVWAAPALAARGGAAATGTTGSAAAGPASGPQFAQHEVSLLRASSAEAEPWPDDVLYTDQGSRPVLAPLAPTHSPAAGGSATAAASRMGGPVGATSAPPPPSFLRSAEQAMIWHRPAVRSALAATCVLLVMALMLQTALLWRDSLAAHWPASAPVLQGLCRAAGCQVLPLRGIESLAVDSSGLNRLDGSALYRLQLVLRNRASTAVMAPALDLSLTDAQGKPVARRVLSLTELGLPQSALQPGQELPIKVLIATGGRRVDGYTVDLFYP